jgi:Transposase domain (DUF772)
MMAPFYLVPNPRNTLLGSLRCEIGRSCRIFVRQKPHRTGGYHDSRSLRSYEPLRDGAQTRASVRTGAQRELDGLLEDDELFFSVVKADLAKRYPNSERLRRHSTPVEVILRMLLVKRLYGWSYEQTEHFVSDSIVLRQFCRLYLEAAPDDTTLIRWANLIGAQILWWLSMIAPLSWHDR